MTRICERCNQDADIPSERCDHPEIRQALQPGDWVRIHEEGMFGDKVARVSGVNDDGSCYAVGDGFGWKYHASDLTVIDPPEREPWLDEDFATDTDGFLAAYQEDSNVFWRVDTGHLQNVIDELIDRLEKSAPLEKVYPMIDEARREQQIASNAVGYKIGHAQGVKDEQDRHHANQCCRICGTHTDPHRGCILR